MNTLLSTIVILFLSAFISGCAGLAVGTYGKKEVAYTGFNLEKTRNKFSSNDQQNVYTEQDIMAHWGKPDQVKSFKLCKVLVYKNGTSWAGVGAFVGIVPLPLAVPSGTYKNRFYLKNNLTAGLVQEYGDVDRMVGYSCGSNECIGSAGGKVNEPTVNAKEAINQWCLPPL